MASSMGTDGLMVVFAVSGSVALLALQAHRRLLSNFMKEFELHVFGAGRCHPRRSKAVRFDRGVSRGKDGRKRISKRRLEEKGGNQGVHEKQPMPQNRKMLYKGIIEYRSLMRSH